MEEISSIEKFTDEKLSYLLDKSQQYSIVKPFVFLPGHKKLLLTIGEKAKEYESVERFCTTKGDSFDHDARACSNNEIEYEFGSNQSSILKSNSMVFNLYLHIG